MRSDALGRGDGGTAVLVDEVAGSVENQEAGNAADAELLGQGLASRAAERERGPRHGAEVFLEGVFIAVAGDEDNFQSIGVCVFFLQLVVEFSQDWGESTARRALKLTFKTY